MKALIVEDDFFSRRVLQKILGAMGDCDTAVNGKEAVHAFMSGHTRGEPYDVVCLDITLPELDGLETLKLMRGMERMKGIAPTDECLIVMTTASDATKDVMDAFRRGGCSEYLVKPVDEEALRRMIEGRRGGVPGDGGVSAAR